MSKNKGHVQHTANDKEIKIGPEPLAQVSNIKKSREK
jgi:hypothetical protein